MVRRGTTGVDHGRLKTYIVLMANLDPMNLLVGLLFGAIASGILIYGWRQKKPLHLIFGMAIGVPFYVVNSPLWSALLSMALLGAWFAAMKVFRE